jgi:hypothetical protein
MKTGFSTLGALILGLGAANLAKADQIFTTPLGAMVGSPAQSVSASADFSLSGTTFGVVPALSVKKTSVKS